jgi:hypothetical protein
MFFMQNTLTNLVKKPNWMILACFDLRSSQTIWHKKNMVKKNEFLKWKSKKLFWTPHMKCEQKELLYNYYKMWVYFINPHLLI